MKLRPTWFVVGVAAGVWGTVKARRAAYRLSVPGLVDQSAALGVGWREFGQEMRAGMAEREHEIACELDFEPDVNQIEPTPTQGT